ncbi:MAG: hypothetical protein RI894_789 [Bacteroidota bacterium]|jgi:hypothetical protein
MNGKVQFSVALVVALVFALTTSLFAQTSTFSNLAAAVTTTAADGKQVMVSEAITCSTNNTMELSQSECVVTVTDQLGRKVYTTILMDGVMALPSSLAGMVHNVDVMTEQAHRTFEVSVREDDDFVDAVEDAYVVEN